MTCGRSLIGKMGVTLFGGNVHSLWNCSNSHTSGEGGVWGPGIEKKSHSCGMRSLLGLGLLLWLRSGLQRMHRAPEGRSELCYSEWLHQIMSLTPHKVLLGIVRRYTKESSGE